MSSPWCKVKKEKMENKGEDKKWWIEKSLKFSLNVQKNNKKLCGAEDTKPYEKQIL